MLSDLVQSLQDEAHRANERRLLVLTGDHDTCLDAVPSILDILSPTDPVLIGHRAISRLERYRPRQADALLGTTRECVVLDAHENCHPNAIGRVVGAVDGGGLLILLAPPLDEWSEHRDRFDETLAVPPDDVTEVAGNFRRRLVSLLRAHEGIAIVDVNTETIERDGITDPEPTDSQYHPTPPPAHSFPQSAYESSRSSDQARAVRALERLREPGNAVVVEADRGRGKSSAVGLAAGALAVEGRDVLVTAPSFSGAREVFTRARTLLEQMNERSFSGETEIRTTGGRVRFESPAVVADLLEAPQSPDVVVVDEAAALPVSLLERFLTSIPVAFVTTIHGYEGAGRGFSVRFRDRLAGSDLDVTECVMQTPIRYAPSDPIERWAFHTLLLDARPAVDQLVTDALPEKTTYERPTATALLENEHRLRELFGLLVLAHYRTEPDDLARLLDAPNLSVRTLTHEGRVVSVALLAREGGLSDEMREAAYRGDRIQGNMLPDLLTGQLRDPEAAHSTGIRVMRIATHPAVRSRGLGSRLLSEIHAEFSDRVDWFGVSYGSTPGLLRFWQDNGYRTVHLSTTRNETSGEHSAVMLRRCDSTQSDTLYDRHTRQFRERIGGMLVDTLSALDPDIVRAALAATSGSTDPAALTFTDNEWRFIVSSAFGPGQFDMYPAPFRELVLAFLTDPAADDLSDREERLLVRRVLQTHSWDEVTEAMDYPSSSGCRRALGRALRPLIERYGDERATEERRRYES
jgi:tRNA(Met) cytidine acetyltransferase